ncbi:MAG: hypothetical protein Q4D81_05935 [Eubacteriales bacterium]|nr:hypothetical protein [Eubacteriales bacterium]
MKMKNQRPSGQSLPGDRQAGGSGEPWPYEDIVHLPHHVSGKHPPMSMSRRAAQFAPFAALTGYDDTIAEAARQAEETFNNCVDTPVHYTS